MEQGVIGELLPLLQPQHIPDHKVQALLHLVHLWQLYLILTQAPVLVAAFHLYHHLYLFIQRDLPLLL